jgi:carbonic anhydrase
MGGVSRKACIGVVVLTLLAPPVSLTGCGGSKAAARPRPAATRPHAPESKIDELRKRREQLKSEQEENARKSKDEKAETLKSG